MKYVRRMIGLVLGVIFLAAAVICVGKIFAIKNINVTMVTYEDDCTENYNKAKQSLSIFKGESLLFLNEKDINGAIDDVPYTVVACEKKFPCTLDIVLQERLEVFAVAVGEFYSMYDIDGRILRKYCKENINADNLSNGEKGTPNVELIGIAVEDIPAVAEISKLFKASFGGLRSLVKSISIDSRPTVEGYTDKLIFNLRCGLKIQIDDYTHDTQQKIIATYNKFCTLTDRQKLSGKIRGYWIGGDDGIINADYLPF